MLRKANTDMCVDMVCRAWKACEQGSIASTPQRRLGRYYSFMPAVLKGGCVRRFETYTERLA